MSGSQRTVPDSPPDEGNETEIQNPTEAEPHAIDEMPLDNVEENDSKSTASLSEVSDRATDQLFSISSRLAAPDLDGRASRLGLRRAWGYLEYNDYDVITVHGVRDDHSTVWKSTTGEPWLDKLFDGLSIRQLDYIYAVDESARVFQRDGIEAEAHSLLCQYSEYRRNLQYTEVDRPILWVCHDVGGCIAKQTLIEATQATLVEDYDDVETWEYMKEAHRRITTLSTAIVFMGCPHKAESIDALEDEIHNLMALPGPDVRNGIMRKIKNIARQVNKVNLQFLDTKLFSRLVNINIFHLREPNGEPESGSQPATVLNPTAIDNKDASGDIEHVTTSEQLQGHKDDNYQLTKGPQSALIELPAAPASPFSRHTLTMFNTFELSGRECVEDIGHAGLIRGDKNMDDPKSWVFGFARSFRTSYYPLKISSDLIRCQIALLSLASPTRLPKVHVKSIYSKGQELPFLGWVTSQGAFKTFSDGIGPQMLHIQGSDGNASRMAMLSQYIYTMYERDYLPLGPSSDHGAGFYFEFDRFDSRYNNIRSMLVTFINEIAWRHWRNFGDDPATRRVFQGLEQYPCWSLSGLFKLFTDVRRCSALKDFVLFLCCFENCVEEERTWFLTRVMEQQSQSDLSFRLVITTSGAEGFLKNSIRDAQVLSLEDCPTPVMGYAIDEEGISACGLGPFLDDVIRKRPVLDDLRADLNDLITECQHAPYLGYRILDWLGHFGRGVSITDITTTVRKLSPVTPESVLGVIIGGLPLKQRNRAILIHNWVRHAIEPLTIEALGHALAASTAPDNMSLSDIDYEQLLDDLERLFCGIIRVEGRDVKFSHNSFHGAPIAGLDDKQPASVHGLLAEACLKYLMQDEVQERYKKLSIENYGGDVDKFPLLLPRDDLLEYAVRFWAEHYRLSDSHRPLPLALEFLRSTEERNRWAEGYYFLSNPFTRIQRSYLSILPLTAALGLADIVSRQIEDEKGSEWFQKDAWLAISEAARNGHGDIVHMLLDRVQVDDSGLRDAIYWAASSGINKGALARLLDQVAAADALPWPKSTISRAAAAGLPFSVSALREKGFSLDQVDDDNGETALHTAIFWGQKAVVEVLLHSGVDLNARDRDGRTSLLLAVKMGHPEIVQMLLDAGSSVDAKDDRGVSAVNTAISAGEHRSLKLVLSAGADFKTGEFGTDYPDLQYPIIHAANLARRECLRLLLEKGADPRTESSEGSVIYLSTWDIASCRFLLDKGVDPNQCYPDKEMLFSRALRRDSKELASLFLEKGVQLDTLDMYEETPLRTPLAVAAGACSLEMLEFLLDRGASVNYAPEGVESPMFVTALRQLEVKKAELLLKRGADVHWKRSRDGWTPLHAAYDMPAFVSLFLKHGADINAMCDCGTVLMMAARWKFVETLKILLAQSPPPDLDAKLDYDPEHFNYGSTALSFAITNGSFKCAILLLEAGAQIDDRIKDPRLVLSSSPDEQSETVCKLMKDLLRRGIKADHVDEYGNTALHGITSFTPVAVIQLLIDAGAPVDNPNANGLTPLGVAAERGNVAAAKHLISKGARANTCSPGTGSILYLACNLPYMESNTPEMVKLLIEAKADPNVPGPEPSRESLVYTIIRRIFNADIQHKLVRYLVEDACADVNTRGGLREYPIFMAIYRGDHELVEYLIRHGAKVNVSDSLGRQILHCPPSFVGWSLRTIRFLVKAGADMQALDNYGRTFLHFAAGLGPWSVMEWILKRMPEGFDINMRDEDGWTPLMWACKPGIFNLEVQHLVKDYGADIWPLSNDGEWSALRLACFSNMSEEAKGILEPPEGERERIGKNSTKEVWDPTFHTNTSPGTLHRGLWCDGCFMGIIGTRYKCGQCEESFDLCFKCFPHRSRMHDADHEFKEYHEEESSDRSQSESRASDRMDQGSKHGDQDTPGVDESGVNITDQESDEDLSESDFDADSDEDDADDDDDDD